MTRHVYLSSLSLVAARDRCSLRREIAALQPESAAQRGSSGAIGGSLRDFPALTVHLLVPKGPRSTRGHARCVNAYFFFLAYE